jgi:hypothetical protein
MSAVWVVEVHAKRVRADISMPPGTRRLPRFTGFSVVMDARTGKETDFGVGNGWPLPMHKLGAVISLSGRC